MYLGVGVLPQAEYVTSVIQKNLVRLMVQHLTDANCMVKELLVLKRYITFPKARNVKNGNMCTFIEAPHPRDTCYGPTCVMVGSQITRDNGPDLY